MLRTFHYLFQLFDLLHWVFVKLVCVTTRTIGPVPRHVAFIMDGNRRYARRKLMDQNEGHKEGYRKMINVVKWCLELGVEYISVYAFSIDNFKRSEDEVAFLMEISEQKYAEMLETDGLVTKYGVEVRLPGDLSMPPPSVQDAARRIIASSSAIPVKKAVLNICFAYTSSYEMARAISTCQSHIHSGDLVAEDVTLTTFNEALLTQASPNVDLLIRTSGETRLSDFMIWQCRVAQLAWVSELWPDFSFSGFIRCIMRYQLSAPHMADVKQAVFSAEERAVEEHRHACTQTRSSLD